MRKKRPEGYAAHDRSVCHVEITPIDGMPRVWREARSALENGYTVTVIGEGDSTVYNGIPYIGFEKVGRWKRIFSRSRKMLKAAVETGASIIQIHSPEFLLHHRYLKKQGKIVIFDSHEFYAVQIENKSYIPAFLRKITARLYKRYETRVCRKIDCVFFPCTIDGKNYFEGRAKRSVKIENYSYLMPRPTATNRPDEYYVIHAGALTEDRGITVLSEAVTKTACKLILCGKFSSEEYKNTILSSSDKIVYKGVVKREELFDLYAQSRIGICTLLPVGQYARLDNMSTKVYEYMQCGLPVIMSNFDCYQKWNGKYSFGLCVDPTDPRAIADAIEYLIRHPDEADRMGQNGRKAVGTEFNWEKESQKMLTVYQQLADDR